MTDRNKLIADRLASNLDDLMEHGPRLSFNRSTWIVAKDSAAGYVKVGGLGAMGVGEMWVEIQDYHRIDPTFADAPERKYPNSPFG